MFNKDDLFNSDDVWAEEGDKEKPDFSLNIGWDKTYEMAGGNPVERLDFNYIFNKITKYLYMSSIYGGSNIWQKDYIFYKKGAVSIGQDSLLYRSKIDNNTTNPVTDNGDNWEKVSTTITADKNFVLNKDNKNNVDIKLVENIKNKANSNLDNININNLLAKFNIKTDTSTAQTLMQIENGKINVNVNVRNDITVPVGSIIIHTGTKPPAGYFECNGQPINSLYPKLCQVLGTNKLPDLRGQFIRGWDHGKGIDKNRSIGSTQGDAIRNIYGSIQQVSQTFNDAGIAKGAFEKETGYVGSSTPAGRTDSSPSGAAIFDASRVVPTADENRPTNVALMYIIKHD